LFLSFRRDPLHTVAGLKERYGDIAHFRVGSRHLYLLSHPEDIREVLVTHPRDFNKSRALQVAKRVLGEGLLTSEGDLHLRQRRLVQPAFHRDRIAGYAQTMAEYAQRVSARWQDGATVDAHEQMSTLTLAIVGKTLFDTDIEQEASEVGHALTTAMQLFDRFMNPLGEVLNRLPTPGTLRMNAAMRRLDEIVYGIIALRRADGRDHADLLSMLLHAQDVEGDGGIMTDCQVRDEAMTLFLAGHETTAVALSWTWYLLSQNPDVEQRLHQELNTVLQDRPPSFADVPRLQYTELVFSEAMRLYPPAWIIGRRAVTDYSVQGYTVPAGSVVIMSQYLVHRDPRWWPDPERFDPDRWTPEAKASRPRFAYFPFGGGPRICVGEPFAWMEGVLLLATLAQHWRLRLTSDARIDTLPRITLRPKYGMGMVLEKR
jgi:cytochrome P450